MGWATDPTTGVPVQFDGYALCAQWIEECLHGTDWIELGPVHTAAEAFGRGELAVPRGDSLVRPVTTLEKSWARPVLADVQAGQDVAVMASATVPVLAFRPARSPASA